MKDRAALAKSKMAGSNIMEFAKNKYGTSPSQNQKVEGVKASKINSFFRVISPEEELERKSYNNKRIYNIQDKYATYEPQKQILVRVFARELGKVLGDTKQDFAPKLHVKTKSGHGTMAPITNPYAFSTKALIVNVPSNVYNPIDLKTGDIVHLSEEALTIGSMANGDKDSLHPVFGFVHPDTENLNYFIKPPTSLKSEEFGFLLVEPTHIKGRIGTAKNV